MGAGPEPRGATWCERARSRWPTGWSRNRLGKFLLRRGFHKPTSWTSWKQQKLEQPADQFLLADYLQEVRRIDERIKRLEQAIEGQVARASEQVRDVIDALASMRGVGRLTATTLVAETEIVLMDGVARYIGETFRKNVGGTWWFDLDGWSHDGLPQIADMDPGLSPVCPLALAREAVDVRCKNLLGTVLKSCQNGRAGLA